MTFPGLNILDMAFTIIASQSLTYYQCLSRVAGTTGLWVTTYADPVIIQGSFQPVKRQLYGQLGLDLSKKYANIYVPSQIVGVNRNTSGDQISFQEVMYQCEASEPWYKIDGWMVMLCVRITPDA